MALDLVDYERKAREAVKAFWGNREAARRKQIESGKADQGERAGVTAGKNMDGFLALVLDLSCTFLGPTPGHPYMDRYTSALFLSHTDLTLFSPVL
jgi:hypothetical protein